MIPEQVPVNEYNGKVNTTPGGLSCLSWANEEIYLDDTMFPERSKVTAKNYCRDPTDNRYLWCYTEEKPEEKNECDIIMPAKNNTDNTFDGYLRYVGTLNTTFSGKTCQKWASGSPHAQFARGYVFPGESVAGVDNYCQDPWGSGYLWCFTTDQGTRWEPCVLKDTKEDGLGIVYQKYSGSLSQTYTGKSCHHWNTYYADYKESHYSNGYLRGNNCRDPLDQGFLWCYTSGREWEPCVAVDGVY
ncbi:plasminogen-like [Mercenaria mercenaria]|uniref:plasminogen-like n=1 Tax=Mercenaria mercenaria TaxID=6596 RepID=UPI00234E5392|nr:plasminogen-like [Mercenaria mercenaria]